MDLPPHLRPQLPNTGDLGGARFGASPLSPAEESAITQVFAFLCLRDGYSPERKLAKNATHAREDESPRRPRTFGALVLETNRIVDEAFKALPAVRRSSKRCLTRRFASILPSIVTVFQHISLPTPQNFSPDCFTSI